MKTTLRFKLQADIERLTNSMSKVSQVAMHGRKAFMGFGTAISQAELDQFTSPSIGCANPQFPSVDHTPIRGLPTFAVVRGKEWADIEMPTGPTDELRDQVCEAARKEVYKNLHAAMNMPEELLKADITVGPYNSAGPELTLDDLLEMSARVQEEVTRRGLSGNRIRRLFLSRKTRVEWGLARYAKTKGKQPRTIFVSKN